MVQGIELEMPPERTKSKNRPVKIESGVLLPEKRKWHQIRIDPLDRLFSKFIRSRANERCERCHNQVPFGRLQCCHFYTRANRKVRWDEDNACALCAGCHQYFHGHPAEFRDWFLERLSQYRFDLLTIRANKYFKIDKEAIQLYLETKLNELYEKVK